MHPQDIAEADYLQLSGIQHFAFCRRQWALMVVENQWAENYFTADGALMHARVHDAAKSEYRKDLLILRDLRIVSRRMGVSGACDVVEFYPQSDGISLHGCAGTWLPFPIEYKRGKPKPHQADELQLCAQAMCLEEMLSCDIPSGALFYGETKRRCAVSFVPDLREKVVSMFAEMHALLRRGSTPKVKPGKGCKSCSLADCCLPSLSMQQSAQQWTAQQLQEDALHEETS